MLVTTRVSILLDPLSIRTKKKIVHLCMLLYVSLNIHI